MTGRAPERVSKMLRNIAERSACYQFLYDEARKEQDPVKREILMRNFEAFQKFVRESDRREWLWEQQERAADEFLASIAEEETLQVA